MNCPKCTTGKIKYSHSFPCGNKGMTRRGVCNTCGIVVTTQELVAYVDPRRGEGAAALAKKIRASSTGNEAPRKDNAQESSVGDID